MLLSMSPVKGFLAYPNEVTKVERRMAISTELARGLKAARKAKGLSMDDLAAQAGLNQSMISRLESLAGNPTLDSLLRISEVLNVELGKLITAAETTVSTGVRRKKSN